MVRCPLDTCRYNHDGTCTKDDVVLEIADIDEHLVCACYTRKEMISLEYEKYKKGEKENYG